SLRAEEADSAELLDIPLHRLLTLEVSSASTYSQKLHFAPSSAIIGASQDIRSYGYGAFAYALESFHGLYFTTDRGWGYLSRSKASLGSQSNSGKFDGKYANAIDLQETIWQIKSFMNIKLDYHSQSC
ncbi:MAG TPA: hypothetical protein VEA39_06375, partial [Methylophilaceae bacterium]|nr:hypothetical protein [Methylophilaceae bacterium]